jgi:hypothetical protein
MRREIESLYGRTLETCDIAIHIASIPRVLNIRPPSDRRLSAYLKSLRAHWDSVSDVMQKVFSFKINSSLSCFSLASHISKGFELNILKNG